MPALIAAPWLGTAIAGIAGGTGAIVGAKMQSGAVDRSAKTQATAATEGARIEDQAAQRREAFERQQAQAQWADAEAARKANYDQWGARQRGLNENYARELMELLTLGVDNGYTQTDVQEVARAFTGWGITYTSPQCTLRIGDFC